MAEFEITSVAETAAEDEYDITGTLTIRDIPNNSYMKKIFLVLVLFLAGCAAVVPDGRPVLLYYYNQANDMDGEGNIMCSRAGLEAVERNVPSGENYIEDTLELFWGGGGLSKEYPLAGVELLDSRLVDGTLIITLTDPQNSTGGGSCRVSILRMQLEATAEQFPEVESVEIRPEELFQP